MGYFRDPQRTICQILRDLSNVLSMFGTRPGKRLQFAIENGR